VSLTTETTSSQADHSSGGTVPIHKTAVIHSEAQLAADVTVGPFAIIEAGAILASGCKVLGHAYIGPGTVIGEKSEVHMHAVIGHDPQDLAWAGEPSQVIIGDRTVLREYVSVHRASRPGSSTRIGDDCLLMVGAHVAHDCFVEDEVVQRSPEGAGAAYGGVPEAGPHRLPSIDLVQEALVPGPVRMADDLWVHWTFPALLFRRQKMGALSL
jgi:UDP-3-O-[3-hydroxymyristoyl] glucosamine N-acyltransferase